MIILIEPHQVFTPFDEIFSTATKSAQLLQTPKLFNYCD